MGGKVPRGAEGCGGRRSAAAVGVLATAGAAGAACLVRARARVSQPWSGKRPPSQLPCAMPWPPTPLQHHYYYLVRHVPRLASVSCSSMQRGSSSAAGRPSSYCSQSASCERLATAPHAAPARPRRGRRAWDRCAECRRSLSTSKRRGGYYRAQRVAAGKQVALLSGVHTSARAHKPRDAGLSPSAGTSLLKQSAGARRAVSVLVPLCEGSARAEQWEPSSVTASAVACI